MPRKTNLDVANDNEMDITVCMSIASSIGVARILGRAATTKRPLCRGRSLKCKVSNLDRLLQIYSFFKT